MSWATEPRGKEGNEKEIDNEPDNNTKTTKNESLHENESTENISQLALGQRRRSSFSLPLSVSICARLGSFLYAFLIC